MRPHSIAHSVAAELCVTKKEVGLKELEELAQGHTKLGSEIRLVRGRAAGTTDTEKHRHRARKESMCKCSFKM